MITAPELARKMGKAAVTITYWCRKLGLPKIGTQYVLTEEQAALVTEQLHASSGRPPGPQPWKKEGISRQQYYFRLTHGGKKPMGRPKGSYKDRDLVEPQKNQKSQKRAPKRATNPGPAATKKTKP